MKLKRILALVLAAVLLLACIPAVHAEETGSPAVVGFEIINEDELPDLIWNEHYPMKDMWPSSAAGMWNLNKKVEFLVTFDDGSTQVVGFLDTVNGESIKINYALTGVGTDNQVTYTLAGIEATCSVTIVESPVDRIELISEPDPLVAGEDVQAHKVAGELGITSVYDACYEGLSVMVYYKDGTSEVLNHEELEFGDYPEDANQFYTFPEHNGYAVEVQFVYGDYDFGYWSGTLTDPDGVVPMCLHYMGQIVSFNATVVEGPVALVLQHPYNRVVDEGKQESFYVGITGPNVTYQWQYRTGEDGTWHDMEGATEASVTVDVTLDMNGWQYRCIGTDENGVVACSDPATLTVNEVEKFENYEKYEVSDLVLGSDGIYRTPEDQIVYIGLYKEVEWLGGMSLGEYVDAYGESYFDMTCWNALVALMDEEGYVVLTEETLGHLVTIISGGWGEDESYANYYLFYDKYSGSVEQKNGWVQENGAWYYYENGTMQTGWVSVGGSWYYMNANGAMQTGWQQIGGIWYYFNAGGAMQTGWQQIGGIWYYFNAGGAMQKGWQQIGGTWYYFNAGGAMQTGWEQIGGTWYYFNAGGAMQTGWEQIGGTWYYFNAEGAMQTGWEQIGGTWYYFNASGAMQTGWLQLGGNWYYLNASGAMVTGTQVIGGVTYYFDASGVWIP